MKGSPFSFRYLVRGLAVSARRSNFVESVPTVFVIDDEQALRDQLQWLFESVGLQVATYSSGEDFLKTHDPDRPGCIILDVNLPGLSGLELLDKLTEPMGAAPVVLLTSYADVPMTVQAMQAGAVHVLQKPYLPQELLDVVRQAMRWDAQLRKDRRLRRDIKSRLATLTAREREVMDLVIAGKANKVIALNLDLSEKMIEVYRARVMQKMQADSLPDLVRLALLAG